MSCVFVKNTLSFLLLFSLLTSVSPAKAHAESQSNPDPLAIEVTVLPEDSTLTPILDSKTPPPSESDDEVQEIIEGRGASRRGIIGSAMSTYRWYQITRRDPKYREAMDSIQDRLLLFGTTHVAETFVLPIGLATAKALGAGPVTLGIVGAVGAAISSPVPVLGPLSEPFCLVVQVFYRWKPFKSATRASRLLLFKVPRVLSRYLGVEYAMRTVFQSQSGADRLAQALKSAENSHLVLPVSQDPQTYLVHSMSGAEIVTLNFAPTAERELGLTEIEFDSQSLATPVSELKKAMRGFGWEVRAAVLDAFQALANTKTTREEKLKAIDEWIHVDQVDYVSDTRSGPDGGRWTLKLREGGVALRPKLTLNDRVKNLLAPLMGKCARR